MDRIEIRGLRVRGRHGVSSTERARPQPLVVDLILDIDLSAAAASDQLGDTVDYATLAQQVAEVVESRSYNLIERLAADITRIALTDPAVQAVEVRIAKPEAPLTVSADEVAVTLRRDRS
jgi:7,8-dihydroneopterin aldolase/epimerase/oxygenase